MLSLLLFFATKGAARCRPPLADICCGSLLCRFSSAPTTELIHAFVTDINPAWSCDEMIHLFPVFATKRTFVYPSHHEIALSGYTHIVQLNVFAHLPSIDIYVGNLVIERKHEVFGLTCISNWTYTQRSMFLQFEDPLFLCLDETQLVIIVVDKPGYMCSILHEQLFIIAG
jgi:hypothetical protein